MSVAPENIVPLSPLSFNPLAHPVLWAEPERFSDFSVWRGHLPFAMLLVDLLHPRLFVELGTHWGDSYCAFCQAVKAVGAETRCVAVDTWQGDEHAGFYGDDIYEDLRAHHDARYAGFSRLARGTFDEAQPSFEDGSIDLLHIDGLHTYEAVKHDFETYRPKLSDRAVVLFHDTAVRENDFEVWRFWDEIKASGLPAWEFRHAGGLGVLAVGAVVPDGLRFLFDASEAEAAYLRAFFVHVADRWVARRDAEVSGREVETLRAELVKVHDHAAKVSEDRDAIIAQYRALEAEIQRLAGRLAEIEASRSWLLVRRLRRLAGRP